MKVRLKDKDKVAEHEHETEVSVIGTLVFVLLMIFIFGGRLYVDKLPGEAIDCVVYQRVENVNTRFFLEGCKARVGNKWVLLDEFEKGRDWVNLERIDN